MRMKGASVLNIAIGLACIVGGATGKVTLIGTNSSTAMVVAGAAAVALGLWQTFKTK
jgi:hypothetical protein